MATVEEHCPASSATSFSEEEVKKLMSQGKRHIISEETIEAVKCFQEACRLLGEKYGQTANECGDAYFHYGKSLLELARLENGVLGNALKEVDVDECDSDEETKLNTVGPKIKDIPPDEKEALKESVQCAMEEKETKKDEGCAEGEGKEEATSAGNKDAAPEEASKKSKEETNEEKKEVDESEDITEGEGGEDIEDVKEDGEGVKGDGEGVKEDGEDVKEDDKEGVKKDGEGVKEDVKEDGECVKENGDGEKKEGKEGEDEVVTDGDAIATMQLAWEMLELARIIFKRINNEESQLKLAQTHLLLGEINMEQEQFTDAISELTKCLNIQKILLEADDRLLAETYYNLGLAYSLSMNYDESAKQYNGAGEVLELRIKNIKERMKKVEEHDKGKGKASDDDPYVKDSKELDTLLELLPEVKEKCLDAKNENEKLISCIKEQLGVTTVGFAKSSPSSAAGSSTSTVQPIVPKKADDISHLLRRTKRKPEEEEQSEQTNEAPSKKSRPDDDSVTKQTENGDTESSEATAMEQK